MRLAALILIFCAVGCVFMPSEITARKFQVVRVIDGDTFSVLYDGEETSVRIANYDAPEPNQPGGAEATAKLAALIAGKRVRLEFPEKRKRDHFGRLLCDVKVGPIDVGTEMSRKPDHGSP